MALNYSGALAPPDSSRSSFLISPSPSPGPSRSPSPSFITTSSASDYSSSTLSPAKRKREGATSADHQAPVHSHSSTSRSNSTDTSLSSGPFSDQSSDASSIPFLRKDANGSARPTARRPPHKRAPKSLPQLRTGFWDAEASTSRDLSADAPCIGSSNMPDRTVEMGNGGLRRRGDAVAAAKISVDPYQQWRERARAASVDGVDGPESPRSVVSKRMFELGLVDHLERSSSTRTNNSPFPSSRSEGSPTTSSEKDDYYDILGEDYPEPPKVSQGPSRLDAVQYKLKAIYSPCPTFVRVPTVEMVENPKLWPATISAPVAQSLPSMGSKRQRRSPSASPPLAPRRVSPAKLDPFTAPNNQTVSVPASQSKVGGGRDPSSDQPQTRPSSPPLPTPANHNPLTWHATEITGHMIDHEAGDDGTGINGVGFKPTKAQEEVRRMKRKRQIESWQRREDQDARLARSKARADLKDGFGLIGVSLEDGESAGVRTGNVSGRRTVTFKF